MPEIVDVVDEWNDIIGCAPREVVDEHKQCHRIVHVLVFNKNGEMALQIRSKTKSFAPGYFSTSVGGYVLAGESYEEAAIREAAEELSLELSAENFVLVGDDHYVDDINNCMFIRTFRVEPHDGPFVVDEEEVESVVFKSVGEIHELTKGEGKFHPELKYILEKYYK